MITSRYLTKSRFKTGMECPTKLFYSGKKELYPDNKLEDAFLQALANGGYQVGELAKYYYPGGHEVCSLDYDIALGETSQLLEKENVIIYEAAVRYKNLFIRTDILIKKGKRVRIVEVKAKSSTGKDTQQFFGSRGKIQSSWMPYLEDIAFQKYVVQKAFPESNVTGSLMLADKTSSCPTSGLNQKFKVTKDDNRRKGVLVSSTLSQQDLNSPILVEIPVDTLIDMIYQGDATPEKPAISFIDTIKKLSNAYQQDKKLTPVLTRTCKSCEFTCTLDQEKSGKKSGFKECWSEQTSLSSDDLSKALVTELWNGNLKKLLEAGIYRIVDIYPDILEEKVDDSKPGLSRSQRQWLQINKVKNQDQSFYFDKDGLYSEMASWIYPLHFIDFETSATAIPFNAGRSPYEQIAFQFSHHIMAETGKVEHIGQFINTTPGEFPNYLFVRALKQQLENDSGTVFRYHNHENTILCSILEQLQTDPNAPNDTDELCEFIKSITHPKRDSREQWESERDMVDLQQMVLRYYFDPDTKGSNSIKAVLPSVLNRSEYLQNKYSKPVYKNGELTSLNFPENHLWVHRNGNVISDPYKSLVPVFEGQDMEQLELISEGQELRDGGAALTAYGVLQFSEMTNIEREKLNAALLRYCELDTLAMVMIFEAWRDFIFQNQKYVSNWESNAMTNHEIILNKTIQSKKYSYNDLIALAEKHLPKVTNAGKYYAVLKFIQKYCTIYRGAEIQVIARIGDPRDVLDAELLKTCKFKLIESNNSDKNNSDDLDLNRSKTTIQTTSQNNDNSHEYYQNMKYDDQVCCDQEIFKDITKDFRGWLIGALHEFNHEWISRSGIDKSGIKKGVSWSCASLFSAYQQYIWPASIKNLKWDGRFFNETEVCLAQLKADLEKSISNNSGTLTKEICKQIFEWGGVENMDKVSPHIKNNIPVEFLPQHLKETKIYLNSLFTNGCEQSFNGVFSDTNGYEILLDSGRGPAGKSVEFSHFEHNYLNYEDLIDKQLKCHGFDLLGQI